MINEKGQGDILAAIVLLIVLVAALWACGTQLSSCSQQLNQAIQSYNTEQSAAAARATDTAVQIIVAEATRHAEATATFIAPTVAAMQAEQALVPTKVAADLETRQNNQRVWSVFLWGSAIAIFAGIFVGLLYLERRSQRTMTPNGPVFNSGDVIVPTGKMIGAIQITRPGILEHVVRWFNLIFQRQYTPPPAATVTQLDGGATAAQYLDAARADSAANALSNAMTSKLSEQERLDRMKALRGGFQAATGAALPGPSVSVSLPTPETVQGPEGVQVRQILERLGLQAPTQWQSPAPEALPPTAGEVWDLNDLKGYIVGSD